VRLPHFPHGRCCFVLLTLAGCASGQTSSDNRISLFNYSEDTTRIRFTIRNNYSFPIIFYQVRLQARCPDGSIADAGGWSFDTLRARASQPDLQYLSPLQIDPIEPGKTDEFAFVRPAEVSSVTFSGRTAEIQACQPSALKDFTAIFADGTATGVRELIDL
jgi:hypothetical protein